MSREWVYVLTEDDRTEKGWVPRMLWSDGKVTTSLGYIPGGYSLAEAQAEVGRWNWREGRSHHDSMRLLIAHAQACLEQAGEQEVAQ